MRAWLPEPVITGPERATERDIEALNRVFAEAFTDRYRRDGLIGVRVPQLNPLVWRYALLDAGAGAMVWRDEHGDIAAFNIGIALGSVIGGQTVASLGLAQTPWIGALIVVVALLLVSFSGRLDKKSQLQTA